MSKFTCKNCQHGQEYMRIIETLNQKDQAFMRDTYDRLVMAEEERVALRFDYECPLCGGSGKKVGRFEKQETCKFCKGSGYVPPRAMVKYLENIIGILNKRIIQLSDMVRV